MVYFFLFIYLFFFYFFLLVDYDYEYGYGPYRGGYPDPYYNGYYPYAGGDYFYDYPTRGGRGRPSTVKPTNKKII